ncbi:MAG TPA: gliding motility-associated ABC transporter substrate-binding protein GldG, partial [Flavisolibacter sp.]|nr:gliding motility-associated ABC transporter substrate-binding protein GldG [Flavisolibacter sp.]
RIDLTEEKRYSLTNTTIALLKEADEELGIDVFLSGEFPAGFRKLSNATRDFLDILKENNPSKIKYRFIAPETEVAEGKNWGDSLQNMGALPINLTVQVASGQQNKYVYPFARITYKGQSSLVPLYEGSTSIISNAEVNNSESMLEYQFVKSIDKLFHPSRPFIGYATGHGEPANADTYDLVQTISANYEFATIDIKALAVIPDTMKVILIVKPQIPFTEAEKLKIDQYIMRGGKVLWAIDNLQSELDSLSYKSQLIAYDRNLNLTDLLFNYGARINADLLMDLQCDFLPFKVGGNGTQDEFVHWNYYPLFASLGSHPINKNLGLVLGRFVNSIDTVEVEGIKKTVLLQSSANARTISTPALISPNEVRNTPQDALFTKANVPAAVLLEGRFSSLYKGRATKGQRDSLTALGGFRDANNADNKMIVIGDGDILLNDFSFKNNQPLPMGVNLYTVGSQYEYQFANRSFLLNCLEYLTANSNITEARNKEVVLRLLDTRKVEEQRTLLQLITIALPILLVIIAGAFYQYFRRRRYA